MNELEDEYVLERVREFLKERYPNINFKISLNVNILNIEFSGFNGEENRNLRNVICICSEVALESRFKHRIFKVSHTKEI